MHVVLKVLASTSIKRRKPWPRLAWIGKEKQNLLLLGDRRVSILYMPSGKTKRKISKLHALIKDCVSLTYTSNGLYLIGLLTTGNIFVWCKDSNVVSQVRGLVDLQARSQSNYKWRPKLFSSEDCNRILVVIVGVLTTEIYLYQCKRDFEHSSDANTDESSEAWWRCGTDIEVTPLRSRVSKDMTLDARFVTDNVFGRCCFVTFVYSSESSIQLVSLVIQWFPNNDLPVHHWQKMALPYSNVALDAKQVIKKGAFVIRWSHDGRILAIAVNQEAINQDQMVFVSPHCKVLCIATLPREYSGLRHHRWICDLAWTHNDLFVVTVNQLGSICLLSRLGEPLNIATSGCSMDLPVSLSLNIHPFIFVRPHNETNKDFSATTADILKQRYSICSHPYLPMFLCSDGYMVTCFQFPQALVDPFKFIDVCFRQSEKYIRIMQKCLHLVSATLDQTEDYPLLASTLHKSAIQVCDFEVYSGLGMDSWDMLPVVNDTLPESDSSDLKSEQVLLHYSVVGKHESGSLVFGARDIDGSLFRPVDSKSNAFSLHQLLNDTKKETYTFLLSVWGILVTVNETWTMEWEERAKKASNILAKLCADILSFFPHAVTGEKVQPQSAFGSVIALITSMMNLCRFGTLNKSVMPIILNTVISIFRHLIKCAEKLPFSLHVLHLMQLCSRLKSAEQIFSNVFGTTADQLLYFSLQNNITNAFFTCGLQSKAISGNKLLLHNRFTPIWIMLYKASVKLISNSTETDDNCFILMGRLQRKLQSLGIDLNMNKRRHKIRKVMKILICDPFQYENVAEQWKVQVEESLKGTDDKSQRTSAHLLHSILYTLLGGYHLKETISFIYWLLTRDSALQIDHGMQHPAIRQTIRSFARFMAAYFVDKQLHVYPYHCPRYFPSLHRLQRSQMCHRIVPVCRLKLTQALSVERVEYHWTPDVMIALFLSSGCIHEVAELVLRLGDWKTALVLFYVSRISSETKSSESILQRILESQLHKLMKSYCVSQPVHSLQQMTSSFQNCFLAGALCDIDVVGLILEHQLLELHCIMRQLPLIVPTDVYLPHPPPYCPQPSEQSRVLAESVEEKLRCQIARHVQLFILLLQTLQCTVHFIDIYLSHLSSMVKQAALVKELPCDNWPLLDMFTKSQRKLSEFHCARPEQRQRLCSLALHFRDFCAVCWFLHVRDKTNMYLRRFWQQLLKIGSMPAKFCLNTLQWAVHLIPFADAVGWNLDVYHLIISVLLEAPRDRRSSLILAQCFPDMSQIPTELDYRISSLLNIWRSTVIKVPSNRRQPRTMKTLSVIHLSQCDGVRNALNQLKNILGDFDKNVFTSGRAEHFANFKARVFEIEKDYFTFLGLMFDVGIIKDNLEDDATEVEIPILNVFRDRLQQQYLVQPFLADKDNLTYMDKKRNAIHEIFVEAETLKEIKFQVMSSNSATFELHSRTSGLFRSLSLSELHKKNKMEISAHFLSGRVKSLSNLDKASMRKKTNKRATSPLPKCSSLFSLCDAINVDQTWKTSPGADQMLEVLFWLVRWMKREDFTGNLVDKCVEMSPKMKIQITLHQLVVAIQQAVNISSKQKQYTSLHINEKRVGKGFLTSTPLTECNLMPKTSIQSRKINDSFLNGDDLDLVKQNKDVISDNRKDITQHLTWEERVKDKHLETSTLTSDNSFSSLDSDIHCISDAARASDDLTSVATSKWTNSGQFPEISSKLKGTQPSTKLADYPILCNHSQETLAGQLASTVSSSTITNQPNLVLSDLFRTPVAANDFACRACPIRGSHLMDTCIQVNDESLLGTPIQTAKKNGNLLEVDHPSTCDDTQNDACSLPITAPASVDETHSLQRKLIASSETLISINDQHEHTKFEQPISERENMHSTTPALTMDVRTNKMPDFTQIRLLHLPAEKEMCTPSSVQQPDIKISSIFQNDKVRRIPALLCLDPECKLIKNIDVQAEARLQPKMLSHQEIQHLQSKFQSVEICKHARVTTKKNNIHKYVVPPLLQLGTSSRNLRSIPLNQQNSSVDPSKQAALLMESSSVSMIQKLVTYTKGVQTVTQSENFTMRSRVLKPKQLAISSQSVKTVAQRGQFTKSSSSQTFPITMKHISTLTDDQQIQQVSAVTDVPKSSISIGINTYQQDEILNNCSHVKYPPEKLEHGFEQTLAPATQTEKPYNREGMKSFHQYTDELRSTDDTDKNMLTAEPLFDQKRYSKRESGIEIGLEEKPINNIKTPVFQVQPTQEENRDKHTNVVDLDRMRERLDRLKNEGLLNVDNLSFKVKNRPQQDEQLSSASIIVQGVSYFPSKSYFQKNPVENSDVRVELSTRMKSQNAMQQKAFETQREMKKESFVSTNPNITKVNIGGAEQQRKKRVQQMDFNHYEARKNEAVRLMKELVEDESSLVHRTVQLRRSKPIVNKPRNVSTRRAPGPKKDFQDDLSSTFILSRGLKPPKENYEACPHSLSASPSRKKIVPSGYVSCSTLPKNPRTRLQPTTYIERLQALQSPQLRQLKETYQPINTVDSRDQLKEGIHTLKFVPQTPDLISDASSCETISPWIVPDEVQRLLFDKTRSE